MQPDGRRLTFRLAALQHQLGPLQQSFNIEVSGVVELLVFYRSGRLARQAPPRRQQLHPAQQQMLGWLCLVRQQQQQLLRLQQH